MTSHPQEQQSPVVLRHAEPPEPEPQFLPDDLPDDLRAACEVILRIDRYYTLATSVENLSEQQVSAAADAVNLRDALETLRRYLKQSRYPDARPSRSALNATHGFWQD